MLFALLLTISFCEPDVDKEDIQEDINIIYNQEVHERCEHSTGGNSSCLVDLARYKIYTYPSFPETDLEYCQNNYIHFTYYDDDVEYSRRSNECQELFGGEEDE